MTVLVLVGVVSVVWGTVFSDYTRSNIVEIANSAAEKLATSYEENGSWTAGELRTVARRVWFPTILGMQVVNKRASSFTTIPGPRQAPPPMYAKTRLRPTARAQEGIS
ncbi:MAG: hypothetical protein ACLU0O_06575 [Collinsella sp.]